MTPALPLIVLLALGNLVIGSSAFVLTGIVGIIADDLQVPAAAVGQAMTAYALATALLAPLVLMATGRWPRRRALLFAMAVVALGNLLCALSPTLAQLLVGRVVLGLGSMFTALAAGLAVAAVPPERRGQALSYVFLGISLSYVIGVPLGAWVANHFGWHAALWAMVAASMVMIAALAWRVPADLQAPGAGLAGMLQLLRQPALLAVLLTTLAYFTAIFSVFSYLGPVLTALVPMSGDELSLTLAGFGVAGVGGTLLGGAASDRFGARQVLLAMLPLMGLAMLLLPFTQGHFAWMMGVMMVWGVAGFSLMAPQQSRLAQLAKAQAPIALSLNTSMLYLGTALGAALSGLAISSLGFARLSWIGVGFILSALALVLLGTRPISTPSLHPLSEAPPR